MLTRYALRDLVWVDLVSPTPGEVRGLMQEFELDAGVAEEILAETPKSKVERHGDTLYVVLHFPALRARHPRPAQEIDFIIGKRFLITAHYEAIDPLHMFAKSFDANTILGKGHAEHGGHLFVTLVQSLYRAALAECDALHERIDDIEEQIFRGQEHKMVVHISAVGRLIHDFRRALTPHQEMLESLEPQGERLFGPVFAYHVRTVLAAEARVRRTLEHLREWLTELHSTNNSLLSLKQNDIMKTLTIMAFTTFPLTLLSSLFAIDAKYRPIIGMEYDFWILISLMLGLALLFFIFFKRKGWL